MRVFLYRLKEKTRVSIILVICGTLIISVLGAISVYAKFSNSGGGDNPQENDHSASNNGADAHSCTSDGPFGCVTKCGFIQVAATGQALGSVTAGIRGAGGTASNVNSEKNNVISCGTNNANGTAYVYVCYTTKDRYMVGYDESTFRNNKTITDGSFQVPGFQSASYADVQAAYAAAGAGVGTNNGQTQFVCSNKNTTTSTPTSSAPPTTFGGTCPDVDGGLYSENYGNIAGDSYVINYSSSTQVQNGLYSNNWRTGTIYARPGDSIRFRHRFCAGINMVNGNNYDHNDYRRGGYGGSKNNKITVKYGISASPTKYYGFGIPGVPADFYFEKMFNIHDGSTYYTIAPGKEFKTSAGASKIDNGTSYTYGFVVYSPSTSASSTYECQAGVFATNGYVVPGYQIPGFKSGTCNVVSKNGGDTSNVGYVISQSLGHNDGYGYVQNHSETPVEVGHCIHQYWTCRTERSDSNTRNNQTDTRWPWARGSKSGIKSSWNDTFSTGYPYWGREMMLCTSDACCQSYTGQPCGMTGTTYVDGNIACPTGCGCTDGYWTPRTCNDYAADGTVTGTHPCPYWTCTAEHLSSSVKYSHDPTNAYTRPVKFDYQPDGGQTEQEEIHTASVAIPYNFQTKINYVEITNSEDIVYGGTEAASIFGFSIIPQYNKSVSTVNYATHTPDNSKYVAVDFYLSPDTTMKNMGGNDNYYSGSSDWSSICQYFGQSAGGNCQKVGEVDGALNPTGNYDGQSYNLNGDRIAPDAEAGTKYCVALGVYPAASHWNQSGKLTPDNANNLGIGLTAGNTWNISYASCRTINKKPTFQVWGGGIWIAGAVKGAVSNKLVQNRIKLDDWPDAENYSGPLGTKRSYGSWEEYLIVAGKEVSGVASASQYGYNKDYHMGLPMGGNNYGVSNSERNKQTVSNTDPDKIGYSGITSANNNTLARLKARYRDVISTSSNNNGTSYNITTTDTGLQQLYHSGDMKISNILTMTADALHTTEHKDGALYKQVTKNPNTTRDNTLVIYVNGTLTIDQNICYSSSHSECNNGQADVLSSYSMSTNAVSALPQIIIFAKNIKISQNVDRVEAWLIMDEDDGGNLDTCADIPEPNSTQCSKTLVVTGPVFAKSLTLNRTAGANPGINESYVSGSETAVLRRNLSDDGSIAPAEIFNLRPDAYYWAYNQAQRSTEAVVTYT